MYQGEGYVRICTNRGNAPMLTAICADVTTLFAAITIVVCLLIALVIVLIGRYIDLMDQLERERQTPTPTPHHFE